MTAYCFSTLNSKLVGMKQAEADGCLLPQVCACQDMPHLKAYSTCMHAYVWTESCVSSSLPYPLMV